MDIDGTGLILGRLASVAAKKALEGENVNIYNCKDVIISGDKKRILAQFRRKREMGTPAKGPVIHRAPSRIVKRAIRGMLPYKRTKGAEAFKRVLCYTYPPKEEKKLETIEKASFSKLPNLKYIKVGRISKELGAKVE
ncbi:50S ribosomal protein L13 [Candidatus Woesearchaeota archaeon]|nr:50S ribosomal protein L13 [Candidatus Woesearchaeota archaeon]